MRFQSLGLAGLRVLVVSFVSSVSAGAPSLNPSFDRVILQDQQQEISAELRKNLPDSKLDKVMDTMRVITTSYSSKSAVQAAFEEIKNNGIEVRTSGVRVEFDSTKQQCVVSDIGNEWKVNCTFKGNASTGPKLDRSLMRLAISVTPSRSSDPSKAYKLVTDFFARAWVIDSLDKYVSSYSKNAQPFNFRLNTFGSTVSFIDLQSESSKYVCDYAPKTRRNLKISQSVDCRSSDAFGDSGLFDLGDEIQLNGY